MSIKGDLESAKNAVAHIITWDAAIELLCAKNQVSATEIARWLILKKVHHHINSYWLIPSLPKVNAAEAESVANYLLRIISPSWMDTIIRFQQTSERLAKFEAVDINQLNGFLESNEIGAITLEIAALSHEENSKEETHETLPQKRLRMIFESLSGSDSYSDILALPIDAKSELKTELLKKHPQIFTDSTFDKAWSDASAQGMIGIADKEKFTPRK